MRGEPLDRVAGYLLGVSLYLFRNDGLNHTLNLGGFGTGITRGIWFAFGTRWDRSGKTSDQKKGEETELDGEGTHDGMTCCYIEKYTNSELVHDSNHSWSGM